MGATLQAIEGVYRTRGADFLRYALARTGDPERARDALQEGFARAIRGRSTFRGSGSLEAWIARCVINAASDAVCAEPSSTESVSEAGAPSTHDPVTHEVRHVMRQLPQRQREALFLRYYLDFDYATIADALGVQVGTVSATLHAAHSSLTQSLQVEVSR